MARRPAAAPRAEIRGRIDHCHNAHASPNPNKVFVFFDNVKLARDPTHTAGWDYDPAKLKAQQVQDVDVVFGCDTPIPG
jgi:hypothetical protein